MNIYLTTNLAIMFAKNAAAHYEQAEDCFERARKAMGK